MAKDKIYYESFPDIYRFMHTIGKRPNNNKFGESSGKKDDDDWYGTKTYAEAEEQFSNGLQSVADSMKAELSNFVARSNIVTTKRTPRSYYYGYAPNIPAAIIGLPKSMYQIKRTPQKTKTIGILLDSTQNCGTSSETLRKTGEAVLKLVYILERKGYRVQLDTVPFCSESDGRQFICVINLKQYSQHLDILKLSFPATSPAMFRRFGFKWAEGIPGVEGGMVFGYGSHMSKEKLIDTLSTRGYNTKSTYCITVNECEEANFDPMKIAENIGITMDISIITKGWCK